MTTFMNQTVARHHVAELIAYAEHDRVRRQFRRARREARREARAGRSRESRRHVAASNSWSHWPHVFGYAG
jgi:hypothetical protein